MWVWFLVMGGVIFLMVELVNMMRGDRGNNQIKSAYSLLDKGEIKEAITQLEQAEETYRLIDEPFPASDTLFTLYIKTQNWEKAHEILIDQRYSNRFEIEDWLRKSIRLAEKATKAGPEGSEYALYCAEGIIDADRYLSVVPYPPSLDSLLGTAIQSKLVRDSYYEGFMRVDDWSNSDQEWWYYEADDGENIEFNNFRQAAKRAFADREKVVIDLFEYLPGHEQDRQYMAFSGRVVYSGPDLADSTFYNPATGVLDSLDRSGSRWNEYVHRNGLNLKLLYWNTTVLALPFTTPDSIAQYQLLKELVLASNPRSLIELAQDRELLFLAEDTYTCGNDGQFGCYETDMEWLRKMPSEFYDIWVEKFPVPEVYRAPMSEFEAKAVALGRALAGM